MYNYNILNAINATLAQLVEQHFRKVEVPGSIPGGGSTTKQDGFLRANL